MAKKWVYLFNEVHLVEKHVNGHWEGVRGLLGGKGANLAEMVRIGVPVPPGFTVTTEACNAYLKWRLLIILFILLLGVVLFADVAESPPGSTVAAEAPKTSADDSVQIDVTHPMNLISVGISGLYLHVQYVNSLADSLLHYDKRTKVVRIGVSIVR